MQENFEVFFAPPDAEIEFQKQVIAQNNPELKIILGYPDSDADTDKRIVVFNLLTGNVYSQTYIQNKNEE